MTLSIRLAAAGAITALLSMFAVWAFADDVLSGRGAVDGVELHDDYTPGLAQPAVMETVDKDVYVTNNADIPVAVRIRLVEYLERGTGDEFSAGQATVTPWTTDWDPLTGTPGPPSERADTSTWRIHLVGDSGDVCHRWYRFGMGSALISMADWLAAAPDYPAATWVYDTDGWIYWVGDDGAGRPAALFPGDTTPLLLDSVTVTALPESNQWYYGLEVQLQAADELNHDSMYDESGAGPTDSAAELLAALAFQKAGE